MAGGVAHDFNNILTTIIGNAELLADSFLMAIVYFLEKNKRLANPNKGKKFYFCDPLIMILAARAAGLPRLPDPGRMVEAAVAVHLIRNFEERIFEGLANIEKVFYWRSTKGKEVDFVALCGDRFLPVEVKFQSVITDLPFSKGNSITSNTLI